MEVYDHARIAEVINRYFAALDDRAFDADTMDSIFSADVKMVRPNGAVTTGPRAIAESHAGSMSRFRATQHMASGFIITPLSDTMVRVRANLVAMHLWADGNGDPNVDPNENFFLAGGVINAQVSLIAGGWRISEVANKVVWRRGVGFEQIRQTK